VHLEGAVVQRDRLEEGRAVAGVDQVALAVQLHQDRLVRAEEGDEPQHDMRAITQRH
jgi:hypothetical protein